MAIAVEKIESIAERLMGMPELSKKNRQVSNQEAIKMLTKDIKAMRDRGYTLAQIVDELGKDGLVITAATLKNYIHRKKAPKGKSSPSKNPTKSVTKVTKPVTEAKATAVAPKAKVIKTDFRDTPDTSDI